MRRLISCLTVLAIFGLAIPVLSSSAMAEEKTSPATVSGATTIDAAKAKELFDEGVLFIDTRSDSDWDAGRIPGAVHMNVKTENFSAEKILEEVDSKDEAIVMYCNGEKCMRSSKASGKAVEWGFSKIYYFRLGLPSWKEAGYPVE